MRLQNQRCQKDGCGMSIDSISHKPYNGMCCQIPEQHHEFVEEKPMASRGTTTTPALNVEDIDTALQAAGIEKPQLPGLRLTIEVELDSYTINDSVAEKSRDSWLDDPIEELLAGIEHSFKVTAVEAI